MVLKVAMSAHMSLPGPPIHPTPNLLFPLCSSCYAFPSGHPSRAEHDAYAFEWGQEFA